MLPELPVLRALRRITGLAKRATTARLWPVCAAALALGVTCMAPAVSRNVPLSIDAADLAPGPVHVAWYASPSTIRVTSDARQNCGYSLGALAGFAVWLGGSVLYGVINAANYGSAMNSVLVFALSSPLPIGAAFAGLRFARSDLNRKAAGLPDVVELTAQQFVGRAERELPHWPALTRDTCAAKDLYASSARHVLEFRLLAERVTPGGCYMSTLLATLMDARGVLVWQRTHSCTVSRDSLPSGRADATDRRNWLREAIGTAARPAATEFLADLR
jgi:hypothetical protein